MQTNHISQADDHIDAAAESRARAALVCGAVGLGGLFIPPGLVVSPVAALVALVLGLTSDRDTPKSRKDAVTAVVLGAVTLAAWLILVITFRPLIARVLHDINTGM